MEIKGWKTAGYIIKCTPIKYILRLPAVSWSWSTLFAGKSLSWVAALLPSNQSRVVPSGEKNMKCIGKHSMLYHTIVTWLYHSIKWLYTIYIWLIPELCCNILTCMWAESLSATHDENSQNRQTACEPTSSQSPQLLKYTTSFTEVLKMLKLIKSQSR